MIHLGKAKLMTDIFCYLKNGQEVFVNQYENGDIMLNEEIFSEENYLNGEIDCEYMIVGNGLRYDIDDEMFILE